MAADNSSKNGSNKESNYLDHRNHDRWLIGIAAVLILVGVFAFGAAAGRFSSNGWGPRDYKVMGFRTGGGFHQMMGDGAGLSNESRLSGVVTSVNGSSFTLAGSGTTNTVETNSSTQWHGAASVKTNDSVVAFGTTNNGSFTATEIVVNP